MFFDKVNSEECKKENKLQKSVLSSRLKFGAASSDNLHINEQKLCEADFILIPLVFFIHDKG